MDIQVEKALTSALKQFSTDTIADFKLQIINAFNHESDFMGKVSLLDAAFDNEPELESLREVFFDMLMINFFVEDVKKLEEDYLDSQEWEAIEEETIDRGTELLNVLLYLKECQDEGLQPELEDFLKEFLLVDEDEFQDEHRIYEEMIANQILMESDIPEIARVAKELPETSEIKDLFYPVMAFFYEQDPVETDFEEFISNSTDPEFEGAVYALLTAYNQN